MKIINYKQHLLNNIKINENNCWNWIRSTTTVGYGKLYYQKKIVAAHRLSWEIFIGKIPDNLFVLHKCDNRRCINPDHLFLGTAKDNTQDMLNKSRENPPRGERGNNKLNNNQILEIREKYLNGNYTMRDLSTEYSVVCSQICYIINNKRWKHV